MFVLMMSLIDLLVILPDLVINMIGKSARGNASGKF